MIRHRRYYLYIIPVALLLFSFALMFGQLSVPVSAGVLLVEPTIVVPTQPPPTDTPTPTETPVPTATSTETPVPTITLPPQTIEPTPEPLPPYEIPEPITVILFGTGLAALSAAAARRRKQE
jgi:hypothetical protein